MAEIGLDFVQKAKEAVGKKACYLSAEFLVGRKKCFLNAANAGKFSNDRTIRDYVEDVWNL